MSFNSTHHTPNINFKHREVLADWKTGFESRLTYKLHLPYQEFIGVSGGFEDITDSSCEYRLVRLSNNLTAVCVHNPDAKQAAAALSVNVGHMANPPELPGLAHLLEHVLFMSSAKYPDEDGYRAYLSEFSGKANAYTDNANTCFHFDVSNSGLEGALDRFSRFFIDPLINADSVHRELHAVDSEHTLYTRMDSWRQYIMFKAITDQTHPYAIYGNGNTGTLKGSADKLGLDLHQELVNFYQKFYSADIMNLVIYGNHGLDQLTEWAVSMFSSIESKGVTKPLLPTHTL
ncbi:Metalloenzyme, LuxS/M16 peptidase-like protein [Kickxella alabastrina]|uniref:Metalloenzyme, LuxS/M16 peptidase-like protein n=1 Tax=Kickxella alabastrina TaxID=61397 RepID=UPI00221FDA46|nr:Metalloenzyme, LuxS/M16 peptidase-like protein [Kickxella alabastrina]KAI7821311.1 Metalloenzyme, LuxS/M16 peptidase-like protein [Kickxella alabastrina]